MKKLIAFLFASALILQLKAQLLPVFVTDSVFHHPESAVYDAARSCVYISNLDKNTPNDSLFTDFISIISLDGNVSELRWVDGLSSPTGIALYNGFLFAVERNGVAMIDPETAKVISRYDIPATGFLNDIAISDEGVIYVSETSDKGKIYKIVKGDVFVWIEDATLGKPNGLLQTDAYLYVGVNSDHHLKRIHLETGDIENVALLGPGNIDGIQQNGNNLLVSHFMGNLYSIDEEGNVEELLNTREQDIFVADFCYIPSEKLFIIPSLRTNKVYGYRFSD
jgi:sugar lactone lactonase YvrE